MSLYEQWKDLANMQQTQQAQAAFWSEYFNAETENYKKILANKDTVFSGKLSELAKEFGMTDVVFAGFMDGINESLKEGYELDSLTCGAISPYLSGTSVSTDVGSGGDSYVTDDAAVPHYYIYTDISDLVFVFGLEIPEDFEPEITDYEIWYSGTQIGERTAVDQQLRHLALDYKGSYTLTVRLYNGDEYVTECEIDTTVMRDVLPIESAQEETTAQEQQCGTYQVDTVSLGSVSTSTLTLSAPATPVLAESRPVSIMALSKAGER